jgi:hypothetical protein
MAYTWINKNSTKLCSASARHHNVVQNKTCNSIDWPIYSIKYSCCIHWIGNIYYLKKNRWNYFFSCQCCKFSICFFQLVLATTQCATWVSIQQEMLTYMVSLHFHLGLDWIDIAIKTKNIYTFHGVDAMVQFCAFLFMKI